METPSTRAKRLWVSPCRRLIALRFKSVGFGSTICPSIVTVPLMSPSTIYVTGVGEPMVKSPRFPVRPGRRRTTPHRHKSRCR